MVKERTQSRRAATKPIKYQESDDSSEGDEPELYDNDAVKENEEVVQENFQDSDSENEAPPKKMETSEDMFDMLVGRKSGDSHNDNSPFSEGTKEESATKRKRLSVSDSEENIKRKKLPTGTINLLDSDSEKETKPKKKTTKKKQKTISDDSGSEADIKPKKKATQPRKKQKKQREDSDSELPAKPKKKPGRKKKNESEDSDFEIMSDTKTKKKKATSDEDIFSPPVKSGRAPRNTKPTKYVLSDDESDSD